MGFNQIKVQILFTFLSYLPGTFAHKLTIFSPQKRHRWFCINILFKETKPDIFYHNHSLAIFSVYLSFSISIFQENQTDHFSGDSEVDSG